MQAGDRKMAAMASPLASTIQQSLAQALAKKGDRSDEQVLK